MEPLAKLRQELIEALSLRKPPRPRYTDAELGEEVEVELAEEEVGALMGSTSRLFAFMLDSGSQNPAANLLDGEWRARAAW